MGWRCLFYHAWQEKAGRNVNTGEDVVFRECLLCGKKKDFRGLPNIEKILAQSVKQSRLDKMGDWIDANIPEDTEGGTGVVARVAGGGPRGGGSGTGPAGMSASKEKKPG